MTISDTINYLESTVIYIKYCKIMLILLLLLSIYKHLFANELFWVVRVSDIWNVDVNFKTEGRSLSQRPNSISLNRNNNNNKAAIYMSGKTINNIEDQNSSPTI